MKSNEKISTLTGERFPCQRDALYKKTNIFPDPEKLGCREEENTANLVPEDTQSHLKTLTDANYALQVEIIRRQAVEEHLRQSEQQTRPLTRR